MNEGNEWFSHIKKHGRYRSGFEKAIAEQLEEAGIKFWHEPLLLPYPSGFGTGNYLPDFGVHTKDGRRVFIEAKGWLNMEATKKMVSVRHAHADKDIRMVFQSATSKVAKLKRTGPQWAKRVGYPAAVKVLPPEWLAEFRTVEEFQKWKAGNTPVN